MPRRRFNIGDKVYHLKGESDVGFVVDARYTLLMNLWEYQVVFHHMEVSLWYYDHELSETPVFN